MLKIQPLGFLSNKRMPAKEKGRQKAFPFAVYP